MAPTVFLAAGAQLIMLMFLIVVLVGILRNGQVLAFILVTVGSLLMSSAIDLLTSDKPETSVLLLAQLALALIYASSSYLFVKSLFGNIPFRQWLPHYLVAIFCLFQFLYFLFMERVLPDKSPVFRVEILGIIAVLFYYGVKLLMYVQELKRNRPEDERIFYIRQYALLYLLFHAGQLIVSIAFSDTPAGYISAISEIGAIIALVYLAFLLIRIGLIQREKYPNLPQNAFEQTEVYNVKIKAVFQQLHQRIVDERLYLNPQFTLEELSRLEQINVKYLSQAINTIYGKNFSSYINHFRLEAFIQQAQQEEQQHLSLLSIAMDCGFSSKSTFNRAFKEYKGCAPSEWLKQQQKKH